MFCGLDVGKSEHHACAVDTTGRRFHDKALPNDESALLTFYGVLQLTAAIDVLAFGFHLSADGLFGAARIAVLVLPALAWTVTHRLCLALQRSDRAVVEHGVDTGVIRRSPHGGFVAVHRPPDGAAARPADLRAVPSGIE